MSQGKYPHTDHGAESLGIESQGLTQHHLMQLAIQPFLPRLLQHARRKVHGIDVLVAYLRQALGNQPRTSARV